MTAMNNELTETAIGQPAEAPFDVAIVGGGASGLSAALTLSRALRRVVVIDSGKPRNAAASHMHGYLGYDGVPPQVLVEKGRAEIHSYGATILDDTVTSISSATGDEPTSFRLDLNGGHRIMARRLLFAGGSTDVPPDIPGLEEIWGEDVHVCPYCHGYEVRNQPLAVLATGEHSVQYALMIRHWSPDLIYFENDRVRPSEEQEEQLKALGIRRVAGAVRRLITSEGRLQAVELENGEKYERTAVFIGTLLIANTSLLKSLGVAIRETPQGPVVDVDPQGRTSATGVWAAGNVTNASIQVIGAAAAGNLAGASINMDLIQEDHGRSVIAMRLAREQAGRDRA